MHDLPATLISQAHALLAAGFDLGAIGNYALPIVLLGVGYFVLIRPMHKQENERKERLEALKSGDKIVLTGGLLGRISKIDGAVATVELADRVKVRVLKKDIVDSQEHALKEAGDDSGKSDDKSDSSEAKSDSKSGGKEKK